MLISPGSRVRRYEVTAPLGAGGMGQVYLARDVELDRTVALKVLSDAPDQDGERSRRFVQEARAAIALNHPNVAHVYDAGEEDGVRFLAMEYVEGETLRARLAERLPLDEAIEIAIQIASALASAHTLGIVHRDIKPENVMIRPDGYVKVLDFGLAKLTARAGGAETPTMVVQTAPGLVMGTMQYMSPEQLRTDDVDARCDVFSLGVVLYEMVSGRRPFEASTPSGVIAAILTDDPSPLDGIPLPIRAVIEKALSKKREDRFASGREMAEALKLARNETNRIRSGDVPTQALTHLITTPKRIPWKAIAAAIAILAVVAAAAFFGIREKNLREARARLPQLEKLGEERQYFAAWDLAHELAPRLGNDPTIARVLEKISRPIDVKTDPPGAQVFLERVHPDGTTAPAVLIGTTPLSKHNAALGDYVLRVEKPGFTPVSRTLSFAPIAINGLLVPQQLPPLEWKLIPEKQTPPGMVLVKGAPRYRIAAWSRPTNDAVALGDFYIDQFEVTNREFAEFIRAGGYERSELWKHPFVKGGRTLTFEEAMRELQDSTGLNAPRRWANQNYPEGRNDYPVTDVTWYEAAAYAEFRGKTLPTVFQWDKAARDGSVSPFGVYYPWGLMTGLVDVARRANFRGAGTMPVTSLRSGMSPFGAYHMAGNVSEWCLNAFGDGMAATGGDFNSPAYGFGNFGSLPAMHSGPTIGFRCARVAGKPNGDQGGTAITLEQKIVELSPVSDAEFAKFLPFYEYPKTPLDARVVERQTADGWTKERIEFTAANGERATAFLYLPRHVQPPYQVIHLIPAGDVNSGLRSLDDSIEAILAPQIRAGRATFGVVLRGYLGRRTGNLERVENTTEEYADRIAERIADLRRGLDYLVTRPEIDEDRIAMFGPSAGGALGIPVAALETRYRCVALMGVGIHPEERDTIPKAYRANFAPRIKTPKLVLHGRWDEASPLASQAMPLYDLLPEPKRFVVVDSGHVPPMDVLNRVITSFFDESLGKVRR